MQNALPKTEGLRERNRRQTLQRIAEVGVELFLAKGYEATTLDEIAAAAGISRRTFFYYFRSKDDILLAHLGGYPEALKEAVLESASAGAPVDVVRDALLKLSIRFESPRTIAIARLIRENDALRASRHGRDLELERVLHEALCELWPAKQRREGPAAPRHGIARRAAARGRRVDRAGRQAPAGEIHSGCFQEFESGDLSGARSVRVWPAWHSPGQPLRGFRNDAHSGHPSADKNSSAFSRVGKRPSSR